MTTTNTGTNKSSDKKKAAAGKKPTEPPNTHTEKFEEELRVKLSREEVETHATRGADLLAKHLRLKEEFAEERKLRKGELKKLESDYREAMDFVRTRTENRSVQCERTFDYTTYRVREVRLDTGEVLNDRPMTEDERHAQLGMFGEEPAEPSDLDSEFGKS
ncbi:MAG TPA: hypothetical protein VG734_25495 [Lacunisphaera sp.]|nr:hypothetical protein [Lacunisphaera sp.]